MRFPSTLLPILSIAALTAAYGNLYDDADGIYVREADAEPGRKGRVLAEAVQGGLNAALRNPQPSRFNNPSGPGSGSNAPSMPHGSNPGPGSVSNGNNGPGMDDTGSGIDSAPPPVADALQNPMPVGRRAVPPSREPSFEDYLYSMDALNHHGPNTAWPPPGPAQTPPAPTAGAVHPHGLRSRHALGDGHPDPSESRLKGGRPRTPPGWALTCTGPPAEVAACEQDCHCDRTRGRVVCQNEPHDCQCTCTALSGTIASASMSF